MRLFILTGIFLFPLACFSQGTAPSGKPAKIQAAAIFDRYIQESLQTWKTPGLAVAVVKNGETVFKKAFGVREKGKAAVYTNATLSTCASTTKAMTAVCMGMLVDEGKVKWSDRVIDILPSFRLSDPSTTEQITIRDLFTHNAGLGNADLLWVFGYNRQEIVQRMQKVPMAYSLRASFIYQNLMYIVAGEVILKLSGKTWDEFIKERLFLPLAMNNTYSDYSAVGKAPTTSLHFKDKDSIKVITYLNGDNIGPAGGVWSCTDDMCKWMAFLEDSARIGGKRLLKAETFSELFKPQVIVPENEFYPTAILTKPHWKTYGLGWFQQDYRGEMVQFHTGSLDGMVAILGMIPSQKLAIYIFGNLDHSEIRHALMFKAFDLWASQDTTTNWSGDFFKLYKGLADTAATKKKEMDQKRVEHTNPSLPLVAYAGKYINELYGAAEILVSQDSLILRLSKDYELSLSHWNFDSFTGKFRHWWLGETRLKFLLETDGSISGFMIDDVFYKREKN